MWNFGVSGIRGIIVRAGLSLGRKTDMEPFRVQLYRLTMETPALHCTLSIVAWATVRLTKLEIQLPILNPQQPARP